MIVRRMIKPEISFINLIDVTLVLLIIFMITAPAMQDALHVELPSANASMANISEGIVVTVTKDGLSHIGKEVIKPADFEERFSEIWKKHSGEPVFIRGDESVEYRHIMNVLSTVKEIGGENVGLVVRDIKKTIKK